MSSVYLPSSGTTTTCASFRSELEQTHGANMVNKILDNRGIFASPDKYTNSQLVLFQSMAKFNAQAPAPQINFQVLRDLFVTCVQRVQAAEAKTVAAPRSIPQQPTYSSGSNYNTVVQRHHYVGSSAPTPPVSYSSGYNYNTDAQQNYFTGSTTPTPPTSYSSGYNYNTDAQRNYFAGSTMPTPPASYSSGTNTNALTEKELPNPAPVPPTVVKAKKSCTPCCLGGAVVLASLAAKILYDRNRE